MVTNTPKPDEHPAESPKPEREETLAERSARLEAEAQALANKPDDHEEFLQSREHQPADATPQEGLQNPPRETMGENSDLPQEQLQAIITALQNELDAAKDQTVRALAEAENTRRRAKKDTEDTAKFVISNFAKDLLEVSDNLRRAMEAVPTDLLETEPRLKNFVDGIEATERALLSNFEKHGIRKLEPMDEPFNPNFHEVMFETAVPGKPPGLIMQLLEPGYILHDRLLRPARVGVTKNDTGQAAPSPEDPPPGGTIDTQA